MKNVPKHRFFELYNYLLIKKTCIVAQQYAKFYAIVGIPGAGKTLALRHYSQNNPDTVKYIRVRQSMSNKDFFAELAKQYDCVYDYGSSNEILNWVKQYHENSNKKTLLIIDEGGKFTAQQFGLVHELRDLTIENLGIILAGPKYFLEKIKAWNKKNVNGIPEFFRRINLIVSLKELTSDEIIAVCNAYEIKNKIIIRKFFLNIKTIGRLINSIENYLFFNEEMNNALK